MKIGNITIPDTVNVLGTEYKIKISNENDPKMDGADGYFEGVVKEIYLNEVMFISDDKLYYNYYNKGNYGKQKFEEK